ncbi:IclR family transcriptional regulator [Leptothrix discophora]|uniref:IclR family transcriptional regulator n=1 Tax=Leptothrix discophora TaxID=89 RepID=UPI00387EBC48
MTDAALPLNLDAPDPVEADADSAAPRGPRGIQSVEVGGQLLIALAHVGRPMALKDLAREAGMVPAKAHPYLVSFGKLGLVVQDAGSGHYGLGPLALQLGLISLQQFDPVRLASAELPALAQQVGHTVAIAVWGNRGPTVVRLEEGPTAVHVNMRHGTVVSLDGTASGLLFAAHRPAAEVAQVLRAESGHAPDAGFAATLAQVRAQGWAARVDGSMPGVSALATPVFDGFGAMVLALVAIGPSAALPVDAASPLLAPLRDAAQAISRRIGWRG